MAVSERIWEGKTVEKTIENALKELNCSREEVDVEILQEPVKGIFGLTKSAKVKIIPKFDPAVRQPKPMDVQSAAEIADIPERHEYRPRIYTPASDEARIKGQETLEKILGLMGIAQYEVTSRIEEDHVILDIKSEAEGLLIGRHGKTREAIQYLVDRISNANEKGKVKFIIDISGYLNRHRESLEKIAQRAVKHVKETKQEEHLEAMSAFDRRIVHLYLKDDTDVQTFSLGEGGLRHVVIAPMSQEEA